MPTNISVGKGHSPLSRIPTNEKPSRTIKLTRNANPSSPPQLLYSNPFLFPSSTLPKLLRRPNQPIPPPFQPQPLIRPGLGITIQSLNPPITPTQTNVIKPTDRKPITVFPTAFTRRPLARYVILPNKAPLFPAHQDVIVHE